MRCVALQADALVDSGLRFGVRMRAVVGKTRKCIGAFLEALALHQPVGLHAIADSFRQVRRFDILARSGAFSAQDIEFGGG